MLVGGPRKYLREEHDGGVNDGDAQRRRAGRRAVQAARVVLQRARPARAQRRYQLRNVHIIINMYYIFSGIICIYDI